MEALPPLDEAWRIDPHLPGLVAGLGLALLQVERPGDALPHLELATQLEPDDVEAHYNLASALIALQRMPDYRPAIERRLAENGMPASLVAVALVESGFRNDDGLPREPTLVPDMRGAGIWMFVPATARRYGLSVDPSRGIDERLDVAKETDAAITYLGFLRRQFGDWHLALAAYNQGESHVARAIGETGSRDPFALAKQGHLNDYVSTVMAGVVILANPEIVW